MRIVLFIIGLFVFLGVAMEYADKQANIRLTKFVGQPAETKWTEGMSDGETRYYTTWKNCSAVIGSKNDKMYYISKVTCYNREK
jgi:hypothetical protein